METHFLSTTNPSRLFALHREAQLNITIGGVLVVCWATDWFALYYLKRTKRRDENEWRTRHFECHGRVYKLSLRLIKDPQGC